MGGLMDKSCLIDSILLRPKWVFLFIKCNFYRKNLHDPPLAATTEHKYFSWWRHIDKSIAIIYLLKLTVADFLSDKYSFDCRYASFCIELKTFIRLIIANSFLFLIYPCCYFYVMSQSTFHNQIRPRPLIACLNCAAISVLQGWSKLLPLNFNTTSPGITLIS